VPIIDLPVGYIGANTDGVSIGGWDSDEYFWGDIQEVAIFQEARTPGDIRDFMFADLPAASLPTLDGYYKLAYSTNLTDNYRNFAVPPPTNTHPSVKVGSGGIEFDEVDEAGEQSAFDSQKNRGANSIVPVSGGFTWSQTVLSRPTPGTEFTLEIGYSSANTFSSSKLGQFDPFEAPVLGKGWQHSFESRIYPPTPPSSELRLMLWDGSVETWVNTNGTWQPRHNEYRGELVELVNKDIEWITPDRLIYRFKDPDAAYEREQGRLYEIEDLNGNKVFIQWSEVRRQVTNIIDTTDGSYSFQYNAGNRLTNISFETWSVNFEYDLENRLVGNSFSGPSEYTPVDTRWEFRYNAEGLIDRITDPRSNAMVIVGYDAYGRKTNEVDAVGRDRQFEYGKPTIRQLTMTDPAGKKWIETYDRKHHLLAQEDPHGNKTQYAYDSKGNVVSVTEPLGWQTTFAYDDRANKVAETNALGQVTTWFYNAVTTNAVGTEIWFNKPTGEVNPLGWVNTWTYDTAGNLIRHEDTIGTLITHTYMSNGLVETSTDANGNASTFTYTPEGFLKTKTDPETSTWVYVRNEWGWAKSVTNPLGQVTRFNHDINGNVVKTVDPLWRQYNSSFDPNGNLESTTDAKGQTTYYSYDKANQRTQTIDRSSAVWKTTYTTRGMVDTTTDPHLNETKHEYDDANRFTNLVDALSQAMAYEYDANNNRIATIDKRGQRWTTSFDRLNRVVAKSGPLGNTTSQTYDEVGRIKTIISPNGYPSEHEYDGRGRLAKWTDAEGYEWHYDYDAMGNITNITDALDGHYVMAYGPRNERLLERNQDGFEWNYEYDELLRPREQTDPNGTVRTVFYDDGGRAELIEFSTGRRNTYVYDDNDNPEIATRIDAGMSTVTRLQYDAMDRIVQCRDTFNKRVNFEYDLLGRRKTLEYPDGKLLTYAYDQLNRLTNQLDWESRAMTFAYDKDNRLLTKAYPNGIVVTNKYDDSGRITDLSHSAVGEIVGTPEVPGLISYYPLDGNAIDESTNSNDGVISGAVLTADRNGTPDAAYIFDGGNSISLSTNRPIRGTNNQFSVSAWCNPTSSFGFIWRHRAHNRDINLLYDGSNRFRWELFDDNTSLHYAITSSVQVAGWRHVCGTYDGSVLKLYVDGQLNVEKALVAQVDWEEAFQYEVIGGEGPGFQGGIDDIRIYNRALSQSEIFQVYEGASPTSTQSFEIALSYAYDRNGNKIEMTEQGTLDWPLPSRIDETAQYTPAGRLIDRIDAINPLNVWAYVYDPSGNMTNAIGVGQDFIFGYDEDNRVVSVDWEGCGRRECMRID